MIDSDRPAADTTITSKWMVQIIKWIIKLFSLEQNNVIAPLKICTRMSIAKVCTRMSIGKRGQRMPSP